MHFDNKQHSPVEHDLPPLYSNPNLLIPTRENPSTSNLYQISVHSFLLLSSPLM